MCKEIVVFGHKIVNFTGNRGCDYFVVVWVAANWLYRYRIDNLDIVNAVASKRAQQLGKNQRGNLRVR